MRHRCANLTQLSGNSCSRRRENEYLRWHARCLFSEMTKIFITMSIIAALTVSACSRDVSTKERLQLGPESTHFRIVDVAFTSSNGDEIHSTGNVYPMNSDGRLDLTIHGRGIGNRAPSFDVETSIFDAHRTKRLRHATTVSNNPMRNETTVLQVPFRTDLSPATYRLELTLSENRVGEQLRYEQELIVQRREESP